MIKRIVRQVKLRRCVQFNGYQGFQTSFDDIAILVVCLDQILYTRLPTGHAHEDVDGVFGTISTGIDGVAIPTFEAFEAAVRSKCSSHHSRPRFIYEFRRNVKLVLVFTLRLFSGQAWP